MPLTVLLILVMVSLTGVTLALHLLGLSRVDPWTEEQARSAWLRQFPDVAPREVWLSHDKRAALIKYDGGCGLVWQFGSDSTARQLSRFKMVKNQNAVRLKFNDFATPGVTLHLDDEQMPRWIKEFGV